ncbi:DMT family transporter [Hoeflea sp. TYP-13]|uniref:DMT family transporter n=1 Tax=Hoeflea sp. TYP-13 TaxID=3230023 RepID=UPI0034C5CDB9
MRFGSLETTTTKATLLVVLAGLGFGTMPFFTRSLTEAGMASYAIEFYRYGVIVLIFFPSMLNANIRKSTIGWGILAGVLVGFGWIGYSEALKVAPVASVSVIYTTYPVFTLLIGWVWFRDKPSRRAVIASIFIISAGMIGLSPSEFSADHLPALFMALTAPLTFGLFINILAHKLWELPPFARIACFSLGAVVGLLPLVALSDLEHVVPHNVEGWWLVIGIASLTALIPQVLYNTFAPVIGAARTSMAGSIELPTNFLIGWLAFSEAIGPGQWIALLLVIGAILMTPAQSPRKPAAESLP